MRPIPKSLLIHSAVLYNAAEGAWQEQKLTETAELSRIRVEPSSKLVVSGNDRTVTLSATLFYDCIHSAPRGVEFRQGQRVKFGGMLYTVETVEELYDSRRLHHLEVGLCL